jgi:hypothetical protein
MFKRIFVAVSMFLALAACSDADIASRNLSKAARLPLSSMVSPRVITTL